VASALVDGVTLRALGLEDLRSGRGVPGGRFREGRHRRRRKQRSEPPMEERGGGELQLLERAFLAGSRRIRVGRVAL
jgi:hypothetical protein